MDNIVKFKKPFQFRIGQIIFFVLMVYLVVLIVTFFMQKKVSIYEVNKGDLSSYFSYKALAIREEKKVEASNSGYITYFADESTKVSAKSVVYALSSSADIYDQYKEQVKDENEVLSEERKEELLGLMDEFTYTYSDSMFHEAYNFRNNLNVKVMEDLADKTQKQKSFQKGMAAYYAYQPGIVIYETDGLESITKDTFTSGDVAGVNYSKNNLRQQEQVKSGDTVYKLVTEEEWYLAANVDEKLVKALKDQTYVDVKILLDNHTFEVPFELVTKGEDTFLVLTLNSGAIRYAKQRYLDIDIIVNKTKGYKIPNSSITNEEFVAVPKEYVYVSGNKKGFTKIDKSKKGKEEASFISTSLYKSDEQYFYVKDERLSVGDEIQMPGSTQRFRLTKTKKYPCVYCVNKGYAVLRVIEPLSSNEDYTIVQMNTSYGVKNYDHIVLDSNQVKEGDMIN